MVNNRFIAVYNPFTKELAVEYGKCITTYTFVEDDEWCKVSFNGDQDHPNYLHIQLDYDECLQLIFYPREDGDSSLHENMVYSFYSMEMNKIPDCIHIAFNDVEFKKLKDIHLKNTNRTVAIKN